MAPPASQRVMPAGSRKDCPNRDYSAMSPVPANATASAKKRKRHKDQKRQRRSELAAQKRSEQKAEDAANKTAKRQSVPFDDVVGPGDGDEEWSDVLDDEQLTQRCSPERTAGSPQSGDGDEDWSGVLDDEQLTQRCSPERTARSPSPEAVRSPSQPPGTQVPVAGQLPDLPELMGAVSSTPLRGTPRSSATFFRRGWSPCRSGSPPPRRLQPSPSAASAARGPANARATPVVI